MHRKRDSCINVCFCIYHHMAWFATNCNFVSVWYLFFVQILLVFFTFYDVINTLKKLPFQGIWVMLHSLDKLITSDSMC